MPKPVIDLDIPDGPLRGHGRAVRALAAIIEQGGYEVVHAHGLRAAVDAGLAARRSARHDGRPTVVATVHNVVLPELVGRPRALVYARAETLVVRLSDRTFAASEEIARRLGARTRDGRVEVLHLGVDPPASPTRERRDALRAELGVERGGALIVCVARLAPQKAVDVLLRAHAHLPDNMILAIVGDGPLRGELERLSAELGSLDRTRWLGYRQDGTEVIAAADVFCLSSVWEACALAAQEAMHLRVPVVSTAVGGMPELIEDRVTGRLVPRDDDRALAAGLLEMLTDRDGADEYAERAYLVVKERFSIGSMLQRLEAAYRAA